MSKAIDDLVAISYSFVKIYACGQLKSMLLYSPVELEFNSFVE